MKKDMTWKQFKKEVEEKGGIKDSDLLGSIDFRSTNTTINVDRYQDDDEKIVVDIY